MNRETELRIQYAKKKRKKSDIKKKGTIDNWLIGNADKKKNICEALIHFHREWCII